MRTSSLVTISLPPKMLAESEKVAKRKNMTRSELLRTALRDYLEGVSALGALESYKKEKPCSGPGRFLAAGGNRVLR